MVDERGRATGGADRRRLWGTAMEQTIPGASATGSGCCMVDERGRAGALSRGARGGIPSQEENRGRQAPAVGHRDGKSPATCRVLMSCPAIRWPYSGVVMTRKTLAIIAAAVLVAQGVAAGVQVGDIPPPRLGTDRDGDRVDLAQMSGKIVVVTFWATWCPPCRKELPVLEAIHNSVGEDRLEVIAVNTEDRRTYRGALRRLKDYRMTLVHDRRGILQRQYGVEGLPHMVIVGIRGKVVSVKQGYNEDMVIPIVDELNSLLRAQARARIQEPSAGGDSPTADAYGSAGISPVAGGVLPCKD